MAQEFEIKARLPSPSVIHDIVGGFTERPQTRQCDLYLDTSARELFKHGIFLRVRNEVKLQIKYTPDKSDLAHLQCQEDEFNLPLKPNDSATLRTLLWDAVPALQGAPTTVEDLRNAWGLEELVKIEKLRKCYESDGVVVYIDTVTSLGQFIEIEVTDPQLRNKYVSRAKEFGLEHIPVGYVELALREREPDTYRLGRFILEGERSNNNGSEPLVKATGWSIESELCKLAKANSIADALAFFSIIPRGTRDFKLCGGKEWRRGGAETYLYDFSVILEGGVERRLMLKACVPYALQSSVESILAEWIERRSLLKTLHVATPDLYFAGQGVVLEEYIPYSFWEQLGKSEGTRRLSLLTDLAHYIFVLSKLGFRSIDAFADLRSTGNNLVTIDFGEDLGPPDQLNPGSIDQYTRKACDAAEAHHITLTPGELAMLSNGGSPTRQ